MPDSLIAPIPASAAGRLPAQALEPLTDPYDFSDLTIEVVGDDSVVWFDDSNSVTVLAVTNLDESDFVFV